MPSPGYYDPSGLLTSILDSSFLLESSVSLLVDLRSDCLSISLSTSSYLSFSRINDCFSVISKDAKSIPPSLFFYEINDILSPRFPTLDFMEVSPPTFDLVTPIDPLLNCDFGGFPFFCFWPKPTPGKSENPESSDIYPPRLFIFKNYNI